jgi:predicted dehydrogenase
MNRKLRWGILSTARIARKQVGPAIQASRNGEVVAVASRDRAKAEALARELNIPRAYGSYEELLADRDVDAIYNALPVSLHAEWSLRCAEAGKPTLCEKPLAANADEARRMTEGFAKRGLLLAEGFMYRYHPLTLKVKAMLDAGTVGKIVSICSTFHVNIRDRQDIRLRADTAGGAMRDVGCYCVSFMRFLTGQEPERVAATGILGEETGVDESVTGALRFPGGALGSFACSLRSPFHCSYEVAGTDGRITVDRGGMVPWPKEDFAIRHWRGDKFDEIIIPAANHYQLMVEDFADSVLTGKPVRYPPEDAVGNMEVIDRVLTCAKS